MRSLLKPLSAALLLAAAAAFAAQPTIVSKPFDPAVDETAAWTDDLSLWDAEVTRTNGVLDAGTRPLESDEDVAFRFRVRHDADAMYLTVLVRDDVCWTDTCPSNAISCDAWADDSVEVFLDGNANGATNSRTPEELRYGGEFVIVANGAAQSDYSGYPKSYGTLWDGSVLRAWETDGLSYHLYRFRFPWAVMGQTERPERIGMTLSAQDDDDGGFRESALYWVGNPKNPFSDESCFGTIVFGKE